jgi:hypothetical protein
VGANYQVASGSVGQFRISSNAIIGPVGSPFIGIPQINCISTGSVTFTPDQEAQVTFATLNIFDTCGPAVRVNATTGTAYVLSLDNSPRPVIKIVSNGVYSGGGSVSMTAQAGDIWAIRAQGIVISAYRNGILIDSIADVTSPTGQPGFSYDYQNSYNSSMDNFIARNLRNTYTIAPTGNRGLAIGTNTW